MWLWPSYLPLSYLPDGGSSIWPRKDSKYLLFHRCVHMVNIPVSVGGAFRFHMSLLSTWWDWRCDSTLKTVNINRASACRNLRHLRFCGFVFKTTSLPRVISSCSNLFNSRTLRWELCYQRDVNDWTVLHQHWFRLPSPICGTPSRGRPWKAWVKAWSLFSIGVRTGLENSVLLMEWPTFASLTILP